MRYESIKAIVILLRCFNVFFCSDDNHLLWKMTSAWLGVCFRGSSAGKESACNAGDPGSIPGLKRSTEEGTGYLFQYSWASLVAQLVKNMLAMWENWTQIFWAGKIPWRRERVPTPVFWPGEFSGLCNPWGHKESDTTEWLPVCWKASQ